MKWEAGSLKRLVKINKHLARLPKGKGKEIAITSIRNEKGYIITDPIGIKK